jgi:hypothetical protein
MNLRFGRSGGALRAPRALPTGGKVVAVAGLRGCDAGQGDALHWGATISAWMLRSLIVNVGSRQVMPETTKPSI